MKWIHNLLGILCAFCLMIVFLVTAVEAVTYWTPGYYEQEYEKYDVTADVNMTMDDLLNVTHEMMAYLRGDRADLHVNTVVGGQEREFFNAREIAHMEDVRGLFLGAMKLRTACLIGAVLTILLLFLLKANVKKVLPRMLCAGSGLFLLVMAGLAALISTDFNKYFIIFHKIFFHNNLWMLDPNTDLLINIVPEPFFMDTALRIAVTFGSFTVILLLACAIFMRLSRKKRV